MPRVDHDRAGAHDVSVLNVSLYGQPIGTITLVPQERSLFAFNQGYIDDAVQSLERSREQVSCEYEPSLCLN